MNHLNFNLALKHDKRTYWAYYASLLRTKHAIVFSFCNNDDYNVPIIKMDLFFINFALEFAVNALFFNDKTMHKLYEDEGKFDFIYQLPQILYSYLISIIIGMPLEILALSQDNISDFKEKRIKKFVNKRAKNLRFKLKIKFIFYFIISTIFLLSFWYYLSMFCAVYKNTQLHLIKDTLISFALSCLYPFVYYLFPGLFRIPSLSNKKGGRKCFYFMSKVLQFF